MTPRYIFGIDLGGTNLKLAFLDSRHKILSRKVISTASFTEKSELIRAVVSTVREVSRDYSLKPGQVLGLGMGLPGLIDAQKGFVYYFPNIPGWKNVNLKSILEKSLNFPVYLDNDANLMALAEFRAGAAKGALNAVCLTLGTGVGGGIIINGSLYRSQTFAAGEIGHMPLNVKGPACNCGGSACLESYIGNRKIEKSAAILFEGKITLEETSLLARQGNLKAKRLWEEVGMYLGRNLVGVVNLLSPDVIVIGGGVAEAGEVLLGKVREIIRLQAMPVQARHVKVVKAKLGNDAGLIGASILAHDKGKV